MKNLKPFEIFNLVKLGFVLVIDHGNQCGSFYTCPKVAWKVCRSLLDTEIAMIFSEHGNFQQLA